MTVIPGLSFVPTYEEDEESCIPMTSFTGTFNVPRSHGYGCCRRIDAFKKHRVIYAGNFSTVYKCEDRKTGQMYAIKRYKNKEKNWSNGIPQSFLLEANILKLLKHENIVNLCEVVAYDNLKKNGLMFDYCVASLQHLIKKDCNGIYERDVVKYVIRQLFEGIKFLHESTVIHRGISCENTLFTEYGLLKICGFQNARYMKKDKLTVPPENTEIQFRAPELLLDADYGYPVDIWSAGCIFAHLLLKRPLFSGDSELEVLKSIFKILGSPSENIWPGISKILQKGIPKSIIGEQPYSDIRNIFVGASNYATQLLLDLLLFYPEARMKATDVLTSPYITDTPPAECSSEKMIAFLKTCPPQCTEESLMNTDEPMNTDM